jgi:GxxExxY protein
MWVPDGHRRRASTCRRNQAIDGFLPIHEAQILTYLRLSGLPIALLLNFNSVALKDGLRRFVL